MHDAIKMILSGAFVAPVLSGCSEEQNPEQNVIITQNIPDDAEVEALPTDEGGIVDEGDNANAADVNAG